MGQTLSASLHRCGLHGFLDNLKGVSEVAQMLASFLATGVMFGVDQPAIDSYSGGFQVMIFDHVLSFQAQKFMAHGLIQSREQAELEQRLTIAVEDFEPE
ncbi:hypothetical protein KC345_g9559 [Hortaea werneckii]|nr:hypothetical protein KC345_g9559 [Hortaea werneckii]